MKIVKISPHGFCAGVTGALKKALSLQGEVYCLHELVHNEIVVGDLRKRGFRFVEDIEDVPEGATVLFSAHGVSPQVRRRAMERKLKVVDATCPFVQRVHDAARKYAEEGKFVYVIGKRDHAEVKGILGEIKNPQSPLPHKIAVVSQTTMNSDLVEKTIAELKKTHEVETMAQVCHATKLRQDAVRDFTGDALLVLGSATPDIVSRYQAEMGKYEFFSLPTRFNDRELPTVRIVDMKRELREGNSGSISSFLRQELQENRGK